MRGEKGFELMHSNMSYLRDWYDAICSSIHDHSARLHAPLGEVLGHDEESCTDPERFLDIQHFQW